MLPMKMLRVFVLSVLAVPMAMAQGGLIFQDLNTPDTYGSTNVGAEFSVELWWGPLGSDASTLVAIPGSQVNYFGTTGGSPGTDGAGTFNRGLVTVSDQLGGTTLTMQVRSTTPNLFILAGNELFSLTLTAGAPYNTTPSQSFTFGIPEPSSMALGILGAVGLVTIRRRRG
jgi:hypothetical protein